MRANPAEQTLTQASAACGLARNRFTEIVRMETGEEVLLQPMRMRVHLAEEHLPNSSDDITSIALARGFSSSQHFAKVYRQYRQCSPSMARRQAAQD